MPGLITSSVLNTPGSGYFAGQVVFVAPANWVGGNTANQTEITINTVGGLGEVLTYTITDSQTGYIVYAGAPVFVQPGDPGLGFTIGITGVTGSGPSGSGYGNTFV